MDERAAVIRHTDAQASVVATVSRTRAEPSATTVIDGPAETLLERVKIGGGHGIPPVAARRAVKRPTIAPRTPTTGAGRVAAHDTPGPMKGRQRASRGPSTGLVDYKGLGYSELVRSRQE